MLVIPVIVGWEHHHMYLHELRWQWRHKAMWSHGSIIMHSPLTTRQHHVAHDWHHLKFPVSLLMPTWSKNILIYLVYLMPTFIKLLNIKKIIICLFSASLLSFFDVSSNSPLCWCYNYSRELTPVSAHLCLLSRRHGYRNTQVVIRKSSYTLVSCSTLN